MTTKIEQASREVIRQHSMECLSDKTVDALREALAEPVGQEPIMRKTTRDEKIVRPGVYEVSVEQAEQEPVYAFRRKGQKSFCTCDKERYKELSDKPNLFEVTTFYAAPVRTKDLTEDEISKLRHKIDWTAEWSYVSFARAVIAAYKEKNRG